MERRHLLELIFWALLIIAAAGFAYGMQPKAMHTYIPGTLNFNGYVYYYNGLQVITTTIPENLEKS